VIVAFCWVKELVTTTDASQPLVVSMATQYLGFALSELSLSTPNDLSQSSGDLLCDPLEFIWDMTESYSGGDLHVACATHTTKGFNSKGCSRIKSRRPSLKDAQPLLEVSSNNLFTAAVLLVFIVKSPVPDCVLRPLPLQSELVTE
jgi:hypothetical protein